MMRREESGHQIIVISGCFFCSCQQVFDGEFSTLVIDSQPIISQIRYSHVLPYLSLSDIEEIICIT
jgi:hypothetical protein